MFNVAIGPVMVRAVAVPPRVNPVPAAVVRVPSGTERVTVRLVESTSPKVVAPKTRFPAKSSVTVKELGAVTVGTSLTGVMVMVLLTDPVNNPSETLVVNTRAALLFRAVV